MTFHGLLIWSRCLIHTYDESGVSKTWHCSWSQSASTLIPTSEDGGRGGGSGDNGVGPVIVLHNRNTGRELRDKKTLGED